MTKPTSGFTKRTCTVPPELFAATLGDGTQLFPPSVETSRGLLDPTRKNLELVGAATSPR
jgi:hypothetical protein